MSMDMEMLGLRILELRREKDALLTRLGIEAVDRKRIEDENATLRAQLKTAKLALQKIKANVCPYGCGAQDDAIRALQEMEERHE